MFHRYLKYTQKKLPKMLTQKMPAYALHADRHLKSRTAWNQGQMF